MVPQISVATEGGSGTPVPDISIEVDDLAEVHRKMQAGGFHIDYGPVTEPWGVRRFYGTCSHPMRRHKVRVALLILLTLTGCAQLAAAPVRAPNASYPRDDNGITPEHGGGDSGGGSGM